MKRIDARDETGTSVDRKAAARDRVRKHRAGLRAKGLKPTQSWVPDMQDPELLAEIRRQCLAVRDDVHDKEALDFIEHAMDYSGWV